MKEGYSLIILTRIKEIYAYLIEGIMQYFRKKGASIYYLRVLALSKKRKPEKAIQLLEKSIDLAPTQNNSSVYLYLGMNFLVLGREKEALVGVIK